MIPWQQHPSEVLTYLIDFGRALDGDTIIGSPNVTADSGVVVGGVQVMPSAETGLAASAVGFTITGGASGAAATVTCIVTTEAGQTLEATPLLDIL